jgi:hypothetical protein
VFLRLRGLSVPASEAVSILVVPLTDMASALRRAMSPAALIWEEMVLLLLLLLLLLLRCALWAAPRMPSRLKEAVRCDLSDVGDLSAEPCPPLWAVWWLRLVMALSCGDGSSTEKLAAAAAAAAAAAFTFSPTFTTSRVGSGKPGTPRRFPVAVERGESPVDDGDMSLLLRVCGGASRELPAPR